MRRRWRADPVTCASSLASARCRRASWRSPRTWRAAARSQRRPASARVKLPSMRIERGDQLAGGVRVAEVDEAVSAPPGQVRLVECEVGQVLTAGAVADFTGGAVEGVAAGGFLACGGGHFGFGGM